MIIEHILLTTLPRSMANPPGASRPGSLADCKFSECGVSLLKHESVSGDVIEHVYLLRLNKDSEDSRVHLILRDRTLKRFHLTDEYDEFLIKEVNASSVSNLFQVGARIFQKTLCDLCFREVTSTGTVINVVDQRVLLPKNLESESINYL